ncbi:helix-turn-helix domain-containing protein [Amycolatopsis magusensis]|uniref:helix-turn-helix domain-containing protein n=1 Tax=Amycolatopsis magusensis TaxID=882444 RepID=UPI003790EB11
MDDQMDIGARIRRARGKLFTQKMLADRAGVSVSIVQKLERGLRKTASISTLQKIAKALDLPIEELVGGRKSMPAAASGVVDLRRALTPVDDLLDVELLDGEPLTMRDARRSVEYLWGSYWAGRYELLAEMLPSSLAQLRATYHSVAPADAHEAAGLLARGYQAAADTLVHLGQPDAGWLGVREAITAARNSEDMLLYAAMRISVSWQLLVQGRYEESKNVAIRASRDVKPGKKSSDSQLAAYGLLNVTAATAAARDQDSTHTDDLIEESIETATRLGYERTDHQSTFGPAKVAMIAVDCAVVQEQYSTALSVAARLRHDTTLPLATRARHLADVALAQLKLGRSADALNTVLAIESMAPDWLQYQTLPRQVVDELLEQELSLSTPLRSLAMRLGVSRN